MASGPIPAILRIDIEPDEQQGGYSDREWLGLGRTVELVERLRIELPTCSGHAFRPNWFIRFDPEIARRFGRADFACHRHRPLIEGIVMHDDPLGIHVHAHRWNDDEHGIYSDYADDDWTVHCVRSSCEAFEDFFGEPPRRSSQGGYFLSETIVNALVELGIEVDVTPEPGLHPKYSDPSMGSHASAPSTDFRDVPRRPYFPSTDHMHRSAASGDTGRPILLVPLTSYAYNHALQPWHRRLAGAFSRKTAHHLPLNPWKPWPNPETYWDLAMAAADELETPYFACAMRTDHPDSEAFRRVRTLFEYLPRHPISRRLRFVDALSEEIRALA